MIAPEWIPVEDQLPEPHQIVDVISYYGQRHVDMRYSHYKDGEHFFKNGRDTDKIYVRSGIVWMKAPVVPINV